MPTLDIHNPATGALLAQVPADDAASDGAAVLMTTVGTAQSAPVATCRRDAAPT